MTQQPPPGQSGGYYQSQYSQQPSHPEQPPYPQQPQQPAYPQQPSYPQQPQQPSYPQPPSYSQQQQPYPQQQAPYAPQYSQDPPPSSPYPPSSSQPGYDYQAPSGYQQPGYYPSGATPTPPAKSGRGRMLGILGGIGGAVLVLGGIFVVRFLLSDAANDANIESQTPEVGECITEASLTAPETEVVDCATPEAAWLVLGNAGDYTENEFDTATEEQLCGQWASTGYILWIGEITTDGNGDGQVVCLEQVTAE